MSKRTLILILSKQENNYSDCAHLFIETKSEITIVGAKLPDSEPLTMLGPIRPHVDHVSFGLGTTNLLPLSLLLLPLTVSEFSVFADILPIMPVNFLF
jgi:hypothetical protein